ncbi:MAG: hypothetical protein NUV57_04175 [archaeon]|nr:hypothetical protein [archaeon]
MNKIILILIVLLMTLAGCTQQTPEGQTCVQVITPAISPEGNCTEFPTPCDVPKGFTLVESCDADEQGTSEEPIIGGDADEHGCIGSAGYSWCEIKDKCLRIWEEACEKETEIIPNLDDIIPQTPSKFNFESDLKYCEYDGLFEKYTWFYQIKNTTDNLPTYGAKVWMKLDEIDKAQVKTIQGNYKKDRILWEELQYSHITYGTFRGQVWDIRNVDTNLTVDYQLIYCEPEFDTKESCTASTGIVIAEGNTSEDCNIAGEVN